MLNPVPKAELQLKKSFPLVSNPEAISRPQIIGKTLKIASSYSQFTLWTGLTGQCDNVAQYHPKPRQEGLGFWRSLPRPPCVPGVKSPQDQRRCPTRAHAYAHTYPHLDLASGIQDLRISAQMTPACSQGPCGPIPMIHPVEGGP